MQIHELTDEMTSIADAGNYFAVDNGVVTSKIDYLRLAKAIIEVYNGSSINGTNQTLQAAIAGLQDEIDGVYVDADTLSDLYSQLVALPVIVPAFVRVGGSVSSSLTNGSVTSMLKGIVIKMNATQNTYDFMVMDGSGYAHIFRDKFNSASEVVIQVYKSTKTLETDISTLNSKIRFVRADITSSGNVSSLITTMITQMTVDGEYYFHGTWTMHSYGYSAHCWRRPYSDSVDRYSGVIIAHDGNTWTFSANSTSDVTVNLSSTARIQATYSSSYFNNNASLYAIKKDGTVTLRLPDLKGLAANAMTSLGVTLATDFRPTNQYQFNVVVAGTTFYLLRVFVYTDGTLSVYNYGSNTGTINSANTITYVI